MPEKIIELYGNDTRGAPEGGWSSIVSAQSCPYLDRKCLKNRKSEPEKTIGTCSVAHSGDPVIICPHRLLEKNRIFSDCIHLLTRHEPGNDFHVVSEMTIPGGSLDYVLASVRNKRVVDFVGIELQTLDSTGSIWPERQAFLRKKGLRSIDVPQAKSFGMNWKMTAKTILVQMHHKVATFEGFSKHLVLVIQDCLLTYMKENFSFAHIRTPSVGDPAHFHAYSLSDDGASYSLSLASRFSTDVAGIETCLGLQTTANVALEDFLAAIESRIGDATLMRVGG